MRPALLLILVAVAGCGDDEPERSRAAVTHGRALTVELPEGWQKARENLVPNLTDPREVLAVGTFPLRYHDDTCAHVPTSALKDIGDGDAFVELEERGLGVVKEGFPVRPEHFGPDFADGPSEGLECAGREELTEYWFTFSDDGRFFHTRVTLGPQVSPAREQEAWDILDSLRVDGDAQPDWTSSG